MKSSDCLTGIEINDDEPVVAIAMIPAKKEYGMSVVSGAGSYRPQVTAISFPIVGTYSDYCVDTDKNFESEHFMKLTGCSEWDETRKLIRAEHPLFFQKEYDGDLRLAMLMKRDSEEVKKNHYPMGWSFFKKETWDFVMKSYGVDESVFSKLKDYLLDKASKIDFDNYDERSDLLRDLSFRTYDNEISDNEVMVSRQSNYKYTNNYFMNDKRFKTYDDAKSYIENDFKNEYFGLHKIISVFNVFRKYDKELSVSLRLGNSDYLPPNDLIALTLKQKQEILINMLSEGMMEKGDPEYISFSKENNDIKELMSDGIQKKKQIKIRR